MIEGLPIPLAEAENLEQEASTERIPGRFEILDLDAIVPTVEPAWLIDGLMPASGLAVIYGLPKCGKSFLVADAVAHVAMGREWAGRATLPGSVVYCAGEGVSGFKRRMIAIRRHYGIEGEGVPFGLIPIAPDLGHRDGDHLEIISSIKDWVADRLPLRAVVIDTLSRTMCGADENAAKDMGVFIDNCERIARELGCVVIVVHHTGKEAERGTRGSIALPAAADVMWLVEKADPANQVTIVAMKDGEDGISWLFRLAPYEDSQQGAASTCIVEILTKPGPSQQPAAKRSKIMNNHQSLLLKIIKHGISEAGDTVSGSLSVPLGVSALLRSTLKNYLKLGGYWDDDLPDNRNRSDLSRDLKALSVKGYIGITSEHVWLIETKQ